MNRATPVDFLHTFAEVVGGIPLELDKWFFLLEQIFVLPQVNPIVVAVLLMDVHASAVCFQAVRLDQVESLQCAEQSNF